MRWCFLMCDLRVLVGLVMSDDVGGHGLLWNLVT